MRTLNTKGFLYREKNPLPWKDSVPAMLAPGEAVVNPPAADMLGRGNINAANKAGIAMFTKPEPGIHMKRYPQRQYQSGTPDVPQAQGGPTYGSGNPNQQWWNPGPQPSTNPPPGLTTDPRQMPFGAPPPMGPAPRPFANMTPAINALNAAMPGWASPANNIFTSTAPNQGSLSTASASPYGPPQVGGGSTPSGSPPYPPSVGGGQTPGIGAPSFGGPPTPAPSFLPNPDQRQDWRQDRLADRDQRWDREEAFDDRQQRRFGMASYAGGIGYVSPQDQDPTWAQIQLSAPTIPLESAKQRAQQSGISGAQASGLLQSILQALRQRGAYGSTPLYGEGSQVSSALGPTLESATQGMGYCMGTPRVRGYARGSQDIGVGGNLGGLTDAGGGRGPSMGPTEGPQVFVYSGGSSLPPNAPGTVDIPPADMGDPFGGRAGELGRQNEIGQYDNVTPSFFTNLLQQGGYLPPSGTLGFGQGPTMIPTTFDAAGYPYAISAENTSDPVGLYHIAPHINLNR